MRDDVTDAAVRRALATVIDTGHSG
jgi:hypothetical protein